MNKLIKRVFKDNFMISLPSLIISVFLILFLIIGLSTKDSSMVSYSHTTFEKQVIIEQNILNSNGITLSASIDNPFVIINPYQISPLTALVLFTTEEATTIKVTVKGKTEEADITYVTKLAINHLVPIYGLYPDHTNTIVLSIVGDAESEKIINIDTGVLPSDISLPKTIETSYEYFGNDLMIFNSPTGGPVGYDYLGDVRWYLTKDFGYSVNMLDNGLLLLGSERSLFEGTSLTGLYEMDYLGKVYTEFIVPNGFTGQVIELPNSNLLVSTNGNEGTDNTIIEIGRERGNIIKTINIGEVFTSNDGKNSLWSTYNNYDISGFSYDEVSRNVFVSLKNHDVILNIDYDSLSLNYIIGDPTGFDSVLVDEYFLTPISPSFEWQYAQSDIKVLENGELLVFDNGYKRTKDINQIVNSLSSYSRSVTFRIDESQMTIEQTSEFGSNFTTEFYSLFLGDVDSYSNNNILVHSGAINTVNLVPINTYPNVYSNQDVITEKSKTYELVNNNIEYFIEFETNYVSALRTNLTSNTNFGFGSNYLGRFSVTPFEEVKVESGISIFDRVPARYEINIIEEQDRLIFTGKFSADDEVYIILESADTAIRYAVPTTKALMENIYDDNYLDDPVTFYISDNRLFDEYYIYLLINNEKHNTYEKISFRD